MVARGLEDRYCRYLTPSELSAMMKYDVTGVGLNLGTAKEYTAKTVGASMGWQPTWHSCRKLLCVLQGKTVNTKRVGEVRCWLPAGPQPGRRRC
jgi:hypothetical protein